MSVAKLRRKILTTSCGVIASLVLLFATVALKDKVASLIERNLLERDLQLLQSGNADMSNAASKRIIKRGPKAVRPLLQKFRETRLKAPLGSTSMTESGFSGVGSEFLNVIVGMSDRALPVLIRELQGENRQTVEALFSRRLFSQELSLYLFEDASLRSYLRSLMRDSKQSMDVRNAAAEVVDTIQE